MQSKLKVAFKLLPGNFLVCLKNRICFYFPFPQEQPVKTNFWYPNTSVPLQCSWSGQLGFCVSQQQTSPEDWAGLEVPDLPSLTQNGAVTLCNVYGFIQPELCWDRSCHSAKLNGKQEQKSACSKSLQKFHWHLEISLPVLYSWWKRAEAFQMSVFILFFF